MCARVVVIVVVAVGYSRAHFLRCCNKVLEYGDYPLGKAPPFRWQIEVADAGLVTGVSDSDFER